MAFYDNQPGKLAVAIEKNRVLKIFTERTSRLPTTHLHDGLLVEKRRY